jgi:uncharacterized protein YycO
VPVLRSPETATGGDTVTPQPGDFVVFHTGTFPSAAWWIQVGTRSRWNHAAIYVGDGNVVEANPGGVRVTALNTYPRDEYIVSDLALSSWQRAKIVKYARSELGTPYGWLDILALALVNLGFGKPGGWIVNRAKRDDRLVCSQLVANAYVLAGIAIGPDAWAVSPGDIAEYLLTLDH